MIDSFPHWIARQAARGPSRVAIRHGTQIWSYAALDHEVRRWCGILRAQPSLSPGGRVAYLGANTPEQLALLFACANTGHVLVPLNWRLAASELDGILADCEVSLLLVEASCAALAQQLRHPFPADGCYSLHGGESGLAALPRVPPGSLADSPDPDAAVLIAYTSGTTGRAKGAVYSARTFESNARNAMDAHSLTANDRVLAALPLFHAGGLNIQTTPALACGAEIRLLSRFDPLSTLDHLIAERPTLMVLVPTALKALQELPAWQTADLSSLRAVTTGSTDVPREIIAAWHARGVPMIQVYGATETGPTAIYQRIEEAFLSEGSIGRPGPETTIRLLQADGAECRVDEPGQVLIRGGHVVERYWNNRYPEAFAHGWFHSGDVAMCDATGRFWFRDRLSNVIISGGENIYPTEIERVLRTHPDIAELAVVGQEDERWGAVPVAVIVPRHSDLRIESLHALLDGRLARYKWPQRISLRQELPRTALGKVDLTALRASLAS